MIVARTEAITIVLLGQPVPWARTQGGRSKVLFTPKKQRNNAALLQMKAIEVMQAGGLGVLDVPVGLIITAEMAIPASWSATKKRRAIAGDLCPSGRPDLSNIVKQVEDALSQIVFRDDSLVVLLDARKRYGVQPKLVITVKAMPANGT